MDADQYFRDIIPKIHDDMTFESMFKIDSSTGNGVIVSIFLVTDHESHPRFKALLLVELSLLFCLLKTVRNFPSFYTLKSLYNISTTYSISVKKLHLSPNVETFQ